MSYYNNLHRHDVALDPRAFSVYTLSESSVSDNKGLILM